MDFHSPGFLRTCRGPDRHGAPSANPSSGSSAARALPAWLATTLLLLAGGLRADELAPLGSWSFDTNLQAGRGGWTGSIQESGTVPAAGSILGSGCYSASGAGFIQTDLAGPTGGAARSVSIWFRTNPTTGNQDLLWGWGGTGSPGRCDLRVEAAILIEFTSLPGTLCEIQYSNNATDWKTSPVTVRAAGNRVQWIDRGPPRTDTPPSGKTSRSYRVRQIPTP